MRQFALRFLACRRGKGGCGCPEVTIGLDGVCAVTDDAGTRTEFAGAGALRDALREGAAAARSDGSARVGACTMHLEEASAALERVDAWIGSGA